MTHITQNSGFFSAKAIVLYLLLSVPFFGNSQEMTQNESEEFTPFWELTPSFISSYVFDDEKAYFATELYTNYWFKPKWAAGLAMSQKFTDNNIMLFDLSFLGSYKPLDWITLNSGLNIGMPHDPVRRDLEPGFYSEAEFNFELKKNIEWGVVVGSIISKKTEVYGGIHFDFEFPTKNRPLSMSQK